MIAIGDLAIVALALALIYAGVRIYRLKALAKSPQGAQPALAASNPNPRDGDPTEAEIHSTIFTAFLILEDSHSIDSLNADDISENVLKSIRTRLLDSPQYRQQWRPYGARRLRQICDFRDRFKVAYSKMDSQDRAMQKQGEKERLGIYNDMVAFIAEIQDDLQRVITTDSVLTPEQIAAANPPLVLTPATVLKALPSAAENPDLPAPCQQLIARIQSAIEKGLESAPEGIFLNDVALLKGIRANYMPDTLEAYTVGKAHPDAATRLEHQLDQIATAAEAAAQRLQANVLEPLAINQRFLDERLRESDV